MKELYFDHVVHGNTVLSSHGGDYIGCGLLIIMFLAPRRCSGQPSGSKTVWGH